VTIPKFPPAPRTPQNRSLFSVALALTSSPSAVTKSTDRSWSIVKPYLRINQPIPPPSVRPASPVCVTTPAGTASPKACVSRSSSPSRTPACARTVRPARSTRTPFIRERSITSPSSHTDKPGRLWPPPRTATASPTRRAKRTASMTSATPAQRAMSAGYRSIDPFHTFRCCS
jgi:hypothetical protein